MDDLMELPDYLSPDFDPSSVTIPRLRNILLENSVPTGSVTQKAQLVALFNEQIAPKVSRLRAARMRANRSSFGIINAGDPEPEGLSLEVDMLGATPRTSRSKSRRRTPGLTPEPPQTEVQPRSSARKSVAAAPDTQPATAKKSARSKSRRKPEAEFKPEREWEPEAWSNPPEGSPFSLDNPFQSGTPAPKRRAPSGSGRPKSRVSSVSAPRHRLPDPSSPALHQRSAAYQDEESDSDIDDAIKSQLQPVDFDAPARPIAAPSPAVPRLASIWAIIFAFSAILFTIWRQEKLRVGYCGVGDETTSIGGFEVPQWIDHFRPTCEDCPHHAFCDENMATRCEPGFVLQNHPFSLGGLIPLAPSCESDGEQALKVKAVVDRAGDYLRQVRAGFECKTPVGKDQVVPSTPEVEEEDLKNTLASMRRKSMSPEAFENLWRSSLGDLYRAPDVHVRNEESARYLSSSSLARVPFLCSVRRWFRQQVAKYIVPAAVALFAALAGVYARYRFQQRRILDEYAQFMAAQVFRQLAKQAYNNAMFPDQYPERFLSMVNLRDDLLRDEFSAVKRERKWRPVQKKVEQNSNVRLSVRTLQHGDVARVWEWIGALRPVEDNDFSPAVKSAGTGLRTSPSSSRHRPSLLHQEMDGLGNGGGIDDTPGSTASALARSFGTDAADPSPLTARWKEQGGVRKSLNADELVANAYIKRERSTSNVRDNNGSRSNGLYTTTGKGSGGRPPFVV